jgi:hypothetical protein
MVRFSGMSDPDPTLARAIRFFVVARAVFIGALVLLQGHSDPAASTPAEQVMHSRGSLDLHHSRIAHHWPSVALSAYGDRISAPERQRATLRQVQRQHGMAAVSAVPKTGMVEHLFVCATCGDMETVTREAPPAPETGR